MSFTEGRYKVVSRERTFFWGRVLLSSFLALALAQLREASGGTSIPRRLSTTRKYIVFATREDTMYAKKQMQDLEHVADGDTVHLDLRYLSTSDQRNFVQQNCQLASKFDEFIKRKQLQLAIEVFKYCALSHAHPETDGVAFLDSSSPLLTRIQDLLASSSPNIAILGSKYFPNTIHGSFLAVAPENTAIAKYMLRTLQETPTTLLEQDQLYMPRKLYSYISKHAQIEKLSIGENGGWSILEQTCYSDPLRRTANRTASVSHMCPDTTGFCCVVHTPRDILLMTKHPLLPYQRLALDSVPKPFDASSKHYDPQEIPYISTVRQEIFERPSDMPPTPNFYDILHGNDCLPSSNACSKCLRDKQGANCNTCAKECSCFCKVLCHEKPPPKHVAKRWSVSPPLYKRDPHRLVPRIVHQTWFEILDPEKYPNMSRLVESFRQSGWEYKFYTDDKAGDFLSTHFPPEVREAYDTLLPGAFKADLFRYCVLLIHGGVYADVDILLESTLDFSIAPDVGFMVPADEPGMQVDRKMCLWNGFIAAAPGHPFLAKVIETVVNQVRNRFTSVDVDVNFCPDPELSLLHAFDTLFTAGPCALGSTLNRVLQRGLQESFIPGEIVAPTDLQVPGRTIILAQDKWDMGSQRFTFLEMNLVVAATDLENADDRRNLQDSDSKPHYSKTHAKTGIYGLQGLYDDGEKADEDIRIEIRQHSAVAATA